MSKIKRPKARRYNYDQNEFDVKAKIFNFKSFSGYLDAMQKAIDFLSEIKNLQNAHFHSVKIKSEGLSEVCFQVELITEWIDDNESKTQTQKAVQIAKQLP